MITSPDVVDDACAFAWAQFLRYQPDRERNWRKWMVTTAEREAWRLHRAEADHMSLSRTDDDGESQGFWDLVDHADPRDHAAIRMRLREALQALAKVPERRRAIKALQVTGFSYQEIAGMHGVSYTLVNRLLDEANRFLRAEQGRAEVASSISQSPRAARLDELEGDAPRWLTAAIGRRPPVGTRGGSSVRSGDRRDRSRSLRPEPQSGSRDRTAMPGGEVPGPRTIGR